MAKKNAKWEKVGELRKTKRPDMLVGHIEIADLNLKIRVVAFVRTKEQKRDLKEADLVILLPKEGEEKETTLSEDLFD